MCILYVIDEYREKKKSNILSFVTAIVEYRDATKLAFAS